MCIIGKLFMLSGTIFAGKKFLEILIVWSDFSSSSCSKKLEFWYNKKQKKK